MWHNIIWEKSLHAIFSCTMICLHLFKDHFGKWKVHECAHNHCTLMDLAGIPVPWILEGFSLVLNFPWLLHWRSDICVCEYCKAFWSLETEEWHLFLPVLPSLLVSGDLTLNTVFFWSPIHFTHCKKRTHIWKTDYGWKLVKFEERCEGFDGGLWYEVFLVPCCVLGCSMASGMNWNLGC